MNYFSSDVFKISLFLVGFFILYGIIIYLMRNRIIKYILTQTDEKKLKMYQSFSKLMPIYKAIFWILPIFLILQILKLFTDQKDLFFLEVSSGVVVYVALYITYLYSKMVLKVTGNGSEKK